MTDASNYTEEFRRILTTARDDARAQQHVHVVARWSPSPPAQCTSRTLVLRCSDCGAQGALKCYYTLSRERGFVSCHYDPDLLSQVCPDALLNGGVVGQPSRTTDAVLEDLRFLPIG